MANILTDIWTKLKTDYQEFRTEWITRWNTRREMRALDQALARAKQRNSRNNATYYVMVDIRGGVSALTTKEINYFAAQGLFGPKRKLTNYDIYRMCVDMVSSNPRIIKEYNLAKSESNEQKKRTEDRRLRDRGSEGVQPD